MPKTYIAFLVGSLALVGIPPLSGFFSKDAILASALASGGYGNCSSPPASSARC